MKAPFLLTILLVTSTAIAQEATEEEIEIRRNVTYLEREDGVLKADLYIPSAKGPHPAILMVHGGAWRTGHRGHMSKVSQSAAKRGYIAVSINYRLAPKHKFPAQIEDCKAAVRWMRTNSKEYGIDPERIAAYGYSAGGHLACLLGTTDAEDGFDEESKQDKDAVSTKVQAIVAGGAPCNFQFIPRKSDSLAYWLGGSRAEKPDVYVKASPTTFVTKDDAPAFFFHGEKDRLVPTMSCKFMSAALKNAGVNSEVLIIEGTGHIGAFTNKDAQRAALKFLDSVLKE